MKKTIKGIKEFEKKLADTFFGGILLSYPVIIKKGKNYDIIGTFSKLTNGKFIGFIPKEEGVKYFKTRKEAKDWLYTKIAEYYDINKIIKYRKAYLDEIKKRK
jgi:hypothetical protein